MTDLSPLGWTPTSKVKEEERRAIMERAKHEGTGGKEGIGKACKGF